MTYADYAKTPDYRRRKSGAAIAVTIVQEDAPDNVIIGRTTGASPADNFEGLAAEEAGEEVVSEIVQGRHDGSMSIPAFWTPAWNDLIPTSQSFIGKTYTIFEHLAGSRPGAGTILNAYTGCVITNVSAPFNARGLRTFNLSFMYERHFNGAEWAERVPT